MSNPRFVLQIGGLAPPIREQLAKYGLALTPTRGLDWDKTANAIARLSVAGLLTSKERDRVSWRMVKAIGREIARGGTP